MSAQVLLEEWEALRASGVKTPDLALWQRLPALPLVTLATIEKGKGGLSFDAYMFTYVLKLYNEPRFDRMILRDNVHNKKVSSNSYSSRTT